MKTFDIIYLKRLVAELPESEHDKFRKLLESKLDNKTLSRVMAEASAELKVKVELNNISKELKA